MYPVFKIIHKQGTQANDARLYVIKHQILCVLFANSFKGLMYMYSYDTICYPALFVGCYVLCGIVKFYNTFLVVIYRDMSKDNVTYFGVS
jgi:hypothetical protein